MKPTDLAWAAGYMDGEGCFSLHGYLRKGEAKAARFTFQVVITNTHLPTLEWFAANFGGSVSKRGTVQDHHRATWRWVASGNTAAEFTTEVLPYLREKGGQAELFLLFRSLPRGTSDQKWSIIKTMKLLKRPNFV